MVEDAPKFYEIAKKILELTESCIFVAHNVFFDYNFIKEEFFQLGYTFSRKKLCTVQLSRRYFKGLRSYSLASLIEYFNIPVLQRHRAMEDAKATLNVFTRIIEKTTKSKSEYSSITELLKENKIPSTLKLDDINILPESAGIYYMRNKEGVALYIGKSKNIRERIFQHFNDTSVKTKKLLDNLYHIDAIETGNELMASLLEIKEIKSLQPEINKALRKRSHAHLLTAQLQKNDFFTFKAKEMEWLDSQDEVVNHYSNRKSVLEHIEFLLDKYNLCKKINNYSIDGLPCLSFQLGGCHGACVNKESLETYNIRFLVAYKEINKIFKEEFYILSNGRTIDENSVLIIEKGFCRYFGYISKDQLINNPSDMKDHLERYQGNVESNRIIDYYLQKDATYKKYLL